MRPSIHEQKCEGCLFFIGGLCRYNPPTAVPDLVRFSPWPGTSAGDTCGGWVSKEPPEQERKPFEGFEGRHPAEPEDRTEDPPY